MAGRVRFHKINRDVHYVLSVIIIVFVLMYLFTGYTMIRHQWFPEGERREHSASFVLKERPDTSNMKAWGMKIRKEYNLNGRFTGPQRNWQNDWMFYIDRPGVNQGIQVHAALDSITITRIEQQSAGRILNRIHHLHAFDGGWKYILWGIYYDLSALALMLFSITGIILWYRLRRGFRWGWIFLVVGFAITAVVFLGLYL